MLAKKYRLPWKVKFDRKDFFRTPGFILKVKPNDLKYNRYGVSVSKKTDKRAVVRNRIRRLTVACLLEIADNMSAGFDILFIARAGVLEKTKRELKEDIEKSLIGMGLIK